MVGGPSENMTNEVEAHQLCKITWIKKQVDNFQRQSWALPQKTMAQQIGQRTEKLCGGLCWNW